MTNISESIESYVFRPGAIGLQNASWNQPMANWSGPCAHIEELPKGISRHPVTFLNCNGDLFAIKEMPNGGAKHEFLLLEQIENLRLPAVNPAGYVQLGSNDAGLSYLITYYLDRSLPFRSLFMSPTSMQSRIKLLDAMASLLVQLHLSGIFWGDCSLSNTLFRHDAGMYQAYLVDAESVEFQTSLLAPSLRFLDLERMEANITAEMLDLVSMGIDLDSVTIYDFGKSLRQRYNNLLEIVTREEIIHQSESYRIQERIRLLNNLGFSIRDIALKASGDGDQLRLRIIVADRSFHRDQLLALTGLETEEMQARKLINEIMEIRATLSRDRNVEVPIEAAAYHWNTNIFSPIIKKLNPLIEQRTGESLISDQENASDPIEIYCQVLEHKWYLSERANQDVGHIAAVEDYLQTMLDQDLHNPES